jgi:tetratricopeptide (TPR) repeat protein
MKRAFAFAAALVLAAVAAAPAGTGSGKFEWTTKSADARKRLADLQARIENFQFGPETVAAAEKLVAADPAFAMGVYYLSGVTPPPDNQKHLDRAVELSRKASDAERRFIDAMVVARANQGANFKDAIPAMEKLGAEYPKERLVQVILGQMYQGASQLDKARVAFDAAERIGPPSPRVRAFLYEGKVDAAIDSLKTYLSEYKDSGAAQGFPEVFIWNSIARIHLENGRLEEAMRAYESGYQSVAGRRLPEDQKQIWLGRLRHGRCRVLARRGKHEEAWNEALQVKTMIDEGGEPAKQFVPAYHYLAGYLKLEAGDYQAAVDELKQANAQDPFHTLLLARAYEKLGDKESARKAYRAVLESQQNGLERALAYPEAKRKLEA